MALVDVRGFDLDPRIGQGLAGGIQTLGQFQQFGQQNLALQREAGVREALAGGGQVQPAQVGQALVGQPQQPLAQPPAPAPIPTQAEKIELARQIDPAIANRQLKDLGLDDASKRAEMSRFAAKLESLPPELRRVEIEARSQELKNQGRDSSHTDMLLDMDQETQDRALLGVQLMDLTTKERLGATKDIAAAERARTSGIKAFAPVTIVDPITKEKRLVSPTVNPNTGVAELKPFDIPEGFEISRETPEEKRSADIVAAGEREQRKESAKLRAQRKFKPGIEKAVTLARAEAADRGEVFNELSQAKAALPGLTRAVDELRELAAVATSTFGGRVFDTAVKETGFGSTKGATARAKFIAIVNNQVLPLLKPTFGGAFTIEEGNALRATMGDIDATPSQKMAQLDAFIDQKFRAIEAKEAQLQPEPADLVQTEGDLTHEEQAELEQLRAARQ